MDPDPHPGGRLLRSSLLAAYEEISADVVVDLLFILNYTMERRSRRPLFSRVRESSFEYDDETVDEDIDDSSSSTSDDDDEQDDEESYPTDFLIRRTIPHPRTDLKPNLTKLKESEFYFMTHQSAGLMHTKPKKRPNSVLSMIQARQTGMYGSHQFTSGDRARLCSSYFPNKLNNIIKNSQKIFCGIYSQDGSKFLSACQDYNIVLYNSEKDEFKPITTIVARDVGWSILDAVFSPDNNYIAYSSWCDAVHLIPLNGDPQNQISLLSHSRERYAIFSLDFSGDSQNIIGGANDGNIHFFNLHRDTHTKIKAHSRDVNAVKYADDSSQIIFSGGDDGLCKVWDMRTINESSPVPVGCLAGHQDGLTFIDSRRDGRHLITNSKDQSCKLWDIRVFSSADALLRAKTTISSQGWDYRFQKAPKKLSRGLKSLEGDTSIMTYRGHSVLQTLIRCRFSPAFTTGQRYIYTGCASGQTVIYDALTGEISASLTGHAACVRDVSWHPYRNELCSSSWDNTIMNWSHCLNKSLYSLSRTTTRAMWKSRNGGSGRGTSLVGQQLRRSMRLAQRRKTKEQKRKES